MRLPLALADDCEPGPDLAVVAPGAYRDAHLTAALLVIEVAESSLSGDRRDKGALYASAGVPEYWIVDTTAQTIEVHSTPVADAYTRVATHARGGLVSCGAVPGLQLRVDDVFA